MPEKTKSLPIAESLPDDFYRAIGEVLFDWSLLELALRRIVYAMLDLSEARGRTAVRTPRAKEMVEMIGELALTEGFTVDLSGLDFVDTLESRRNLLAHGIWFLGADGKYLLRDLNGTWPREPKEPVRVKRRLIPAGIPMTADSIHDLVNSIRIATHNTYAVAQAIRARREASQQKRHEPTLPPSSRGPSGKKAR